MAKECGISTNGKIQGWSRQIFHDSRRRLQPCQTSNNGIKEILSHSS